MLKAIVSVTSSARDINGNTYHFARFYNPLKGRDSIAVSVSSEQEATKIARELVSGDYEEVLVFREELPVKEFHETKRISKPYLDAYAEDCRLVLENLYAEDSFAELKRLMMQLRVSLDARAKLG